MELDDVLPVATSGSLWLVRSGAVGHVETYEGACVICGTRWPCAVWVDDREAYDAEVVE